MMDESDRAKVEAEIKSCYSTWATDYFADYYTNPQAYPPVHLQIIRKLIADSGARTLLDAGCGPASVLRSLTDMGLDLYGFDLTPQMVDVARDVVGQAGIPASHIWEGSVADRAHFTRPGATPNSFDAAICIGVLPHLPERTEDVALANLHAALRPGGMVAIEARNQLFGLFSLNRYSYDLFCSELIRADALRQQMEDTSALDHALADLKNRFRMDLPPARGGKQDEPGYDEVLSRTHNPFVVSQKLREAGFKDVKVLFYHYHCLPPMFESAMPDEYRAQSTAMESAEDWRGHFMASAFIVTGTKR